MAIPFSFKFLDRGRFPFVGTRAFTEPPISPLSFIVKSNDWTLRLGDDCRPALTVSIVSKTMFDSAGGGWEQNTCNLPSQPHSEPKP
jgi:hypothetical protein